MNGAPAEEVAELRHQIEILEAENDELSQVIDNQDEQIADLQDQVEVKDQTIADLRTELQNKQSQIQELSAELLHYQQDIFIINGIPRILFRGTPTTISGSGFTIGVDFDNYIATPTNNQSVFVYNSAGAYGANHHHFRFSYDFSVSPIIYDSRQISLYDRTLRLRDSTSIYPWNNDWCFPMYYQDTRQQLSIFVVDFANDLYVIFYVSSDFQNHTCYVTQEFVPIDLSHITINPNYDNNVVPFQS